MIEENEFIVFLLGLGAVIFSQANRSRLRHAPSPGILLAGFYVLVAGSLLATLEGFFLQDALNFLEHVCYAISAILMAAWCWKTFGRREASHESR
jgi:hypothetical protein